MHLGKKIEAAFVAYLASLTLPAGFTAPQIHGGQSDEQKDNQLIVIVASDSSEEVPPKTANFMVPVGIEVQTPFTSDTEADGLTLAESSQAQHDLAAEFLEAALLDDNLHSLLSEAVDDLSVSPIPTRNIIHGQSDGCYISGVSMQIHCRGTA